MTDAFEDWIVAMSDEKYEDMLDDGFTRRQKSKALTIRDSLDGQMEKLRDVEREQESGVNEVEVKQPVRIYDNRELPSTDTKYVATPSGDSAVILPRQKSTREFIKRAIQSEMRLPITSQQQSREIQKRSILQRLKQFFRRR